MNKNMVLLAEQFVESVRLTGEIWKNLVELGYEF